jgi:hypothetical protein
VFTTIIAAPSFGGSISLSDLYNGGAPFLGDNVMITDLIETNGAPADPAINFMRDPIMFGDRLDLTPVGLRAEVIPGPGTASYQTSVSMTIMANPGLVITGLCFDEEGDYSVFGNSSVDATLNVSWEEITAGVPASGMDTASFVATTGGGLWDLGLNVPVTGAPNKITVTFENILTADADDELSMAFIAKKVFSGLEVKTMIPEPTGISMAMIGLLACTALRRQRVY